MQWYTSILLLITVLKSLKILKIRGWRVMRLQEGWSVGTTYLLQSICQVWGGDFCYISELIPKKRGLFRLYQPDPEGRDTSEQRHVLKLDIQETTVSKHQIGWTVNMQAPTPISQLTCTPADQFPVVSASVMYKTFSQLYTPSLSNCLLAANIHHQLAAEYSTETVSALVWLFSVSSS